MRKTTLTFFLLFAVIALGGAQQSKPAEALDGVDPVLLIQGKEISGKKEFTSVRNGFEYLFASADTKALFEKNPARYEIQMNGLCARMGKATGANPSDYLIYDGKIYIFGSDECHRRFQENPKKYLAAPAPPLETSPQAQRAGRDLIARVLATTGGEKQIDGVTTYVETATLVQQRNGADVPLTTKTMWRFPGDVRMERTVTLSDRVMSSAVLVTPAGIWFLGQDAAYPGVEAGRPSMQLDYGRQIVPLLHSRVQPGFKAAAIGRRTVRDLKLDLVRVVNGAVDVTLGVEPSSGQVRTISFADRNSEGEVGEYLIVYSDYRAVAGLTLPFSEQAFFGGTPDRNLSRRIEKIDVNAPLAASLFQPRSAGNK
jgi:YHS domain-containing protein